MSTVRQGLSIKWRLLMISMLSASVGIILAGSMMAQKIVSLTEQDMQDSLSMLNQVLAHSVSAAMLFDDEKAAQEIVKTVAVDERIELVCLYRPGGHLFLSEQLHSGQHCPDQLPAGAEAIEGFVGMSHQVEERNERVGTVYIRASTARLQQTKQQSILIVLLVTLGAILLSSLMARLLQRLITRPILRLVAATQAVSSHDLAYRLRPEKGEFGVLAQFFNSMLERLQQHQEALVSTRDEALAASRSKSIFLANMSHELRTPLNAIIGYSELLLEDLDDHDQQACQADLKKIRSSGLHLLALINDILDVSKIEAGKMDFTRQTITLAPFIQAIANNMLAVMEANQNVFEVQLAEKLGNIETDGLRLKQIIINLLSNAAKFTHQGRITLTVQTLVQDGCAWIEIQVIDTGIGISPEQQEKIFEAFTQADDSTTREYGGTGLGLAISRKFAQLLGGTIELESELGRGATFVFKFPVIAEHLSPVQASISATT